jgi:hypothetical protein
MCQRTGDDFPLADALPDAEPFPAEPFPDAEVGRQTEILLLCPDCDEAFPPRFYRRCHACGHDFGSGYEPPAPVKQELSERAVLVLFGLMLLLLGGILYFWLLFR